MTGALLVAGTQSDAGKSLVTAGICRWLARRGVRVAPFKAQNMALNSAVTPGGAEIGRAQAMQAAAAGVAARGGHEPGADQARRAPRHSQVAAHGAPVRRRRRALLPGAQARACARRCSTALDDLRSRYDVVVCEGAGSPAEINLRAGDLANMGLARAAGLPVVVVGDIDRGGVFASLVRHARAARARRPGARSAAS